MHRITIDSDTSPCIPQFALAILARLKAERQARLDWHRRLTEEHAARVRLAQQVREQHANRRLLGA